MMIDPLDSGFLDEVTFIASDAHLSAMKQLNDEQKSGASVILWQ